MDSLDLDQVVDEIIPRGDMAPKVSRPTDLVLRQTAPASDDATAALALVSEAAEAIRKLGLDPRRMLINSREGQGGPLLEAIYTRVLEAGGQIYLGKDARLPRHVFERMYPELPQWKRVRNQWDPKAVFQSELGRRLGLSGGAP